MISYAPKKLTAGIELLAPAGNMEKLEVAIEYGADAVYLGTEKYSLRAAAHNFNAYTGELKAAVDKAHAQGLAVYVTLNILAVPKDFPDIENTILAIGQSGADAVILADPGLLTLVKKLCPHLEIHISTQASVSNAQACKFWYEQGASRIVLARELSLEDIKKIRVETPSDLKLEAFVHGAMCMAWSGRCLLSAHLSGRSANKGACTQTCRWQFQTRPINSLLLSEQGHPEKELILEEDEYGSYILNAGDLCMIEHIPELMASGIDSWKIEGRTKSTFYLATVVKAYREAIDEWAANPKNYQPSSEHLRELNLTVHRPFNTGFYFDSPQKDAKVNAQAVMIKNADVVGQVKGILRQEGLMLVEQRNKIKQGEKLEIIRPKGPYVELNISNIWDLEMNPITDTPHPQMLYYLPLEEQAIVGSFIRRVKAN